MSYPLKNGQTSIVLRFKLLDSTSTVGAGLTGLTSASSGLIISTIADNEATATAYTVAGSTIETITTLGTFAAPTATKCRFKEVDAANHKGIYEFQFADARFAVAGAKSLLISVLGATALAQADYVVPLVSDDPYGAKPANWNLFSIDSNGRVDVIKIAGTTQTARDIGASVLLSTGTGTGQLDFTSGVVKANAVQLLGTAWLTPGTAGTPDVNAKLLGATAQTGRDIGTSVLISSGTGTGQLSVTSGIISANLAQILGTALTETAGLIAAGFKKFFNIPGPTGTVNSLPDAVPSNSAGLPLKSDLLAGTAIADAVLDRADAIEAGVTLRQAQRLQLSAAAGKLSGAATATVSIRDTGDTKNRIVATVDANGNRSAVTLDGT